MTAPPSRPPSRLFAATTSPAPEAREASSTRTTERSANWDQLGLPCAVIAADGRLQHVNRAFRLLMRSSSNEQDSTTLDWLARFSTEARAAIFTALADRQTHAGPLAWRGAKAEATRWFDLTLRWRHTGTRCVATLHDVTLLRQAELAAREQVEQLRAMAQAAPLAQAYFDAEALRCGHANQAFALAFGLDEHALPGLTLGEIVGPQLYGDLLPGLEQIRSTRRRVAFRHTRPQPQGVALAWQVALVPRFDAQGLLQGLVMLLEDVTRQEQTERAMAESEQRLARFLQAAEEGIVLHDGGHISDVNPAFCELTGHALHDLLGRPLAELMPAEEHTRLAALIHSTVAGGPGQRADSALLHKNGTRIPVELIARNADEQDAPLQMVVVRDVRDRHAAQARMHYLAHHDNLTGLPNRQAFMAQLEHLMVAARASNTQLGLLFIDLDHFKRVNDSVGHAAGDTQLKIVARRIGEQVRSSDRVARFGGDEFMVLLPGVRDADDALQVAQKLNTALAEPIDIEGRPISVTASIGVALYPRDGATPDLLIKHADTAMHEAKSRGRATYAMFEPAIAASAYANLVLEGQLGHAIEKGEFELLFQPQVYAADGRVAGAEALIRWHHPQRGLVKPDEFIALAEQHRLMLPIGDWVLHEAGRCARHWHQQRGGQPLSMAVNLSTMQFQAPDFIDSVQRVLSETGLPPGWLELELTERMLMDNLEPTLERLHALRALGVRLSVDDFGTGTSSLSQLQRLPIDKMKIDRAFVKGLPDDRPSLAIAGAIVQLARGLGLTVVAEGVEQPAQWHCLAKLGCDQLQGMGISPPLGTDEFEAWLARPPHRP